MSEVLTSYINNFCSLVGMATRFRSLAFYQLSSRAGDKHTQIRAEEWPNHSY